MISSEVLNKITQLIVSGYNPECIILFGSQARGDADTKSDIDILVLTELQEEKFSLMNRIRHTLAVVNYAVDVIVMSPSEYNTEKKYPGTLARYANKEGLVLYGRVSSFEPGFFLAF